MTHGREPLFGKVVYGEMVLNEYGRIVAEEWERSGAIRAEIELDEYVVMPNHFHAIANFFQPGTGDHPVGAYGSKKRWSAKTATIRPYNNRHFDPPRER